MLAPGHATYEGERVHVRDAINEPRSIQEQIPLIVGGNGRVRTAGLAVRFADELNFVFREPELGRRAHDRGPRHVRGGRPRPRHPALLGLHARRGLPSTPARRASTSSARGPRSGVDRIICFPTKLDPSLEAQAAFAEDVKAAGVALDGA